MWLLDLDAVDASMIDVVGGKALNLGVLSTHGLPVPNGFCLTTAAFREVVGDRIDDLLDAFDRSAEDLGEVARLAGVARQRVEQLDLPDALVREISARYADLGVDEPVAVRSSATAEDLPQASFAGQQDTYLNVVGDSALLVAIRRCWASLWTDRAVSYRAANGIDHTTVSLAVVVQRMVQAEVAGVMFTANPVSGSRHQAVIDASPGLGEAVVSGSVNPDRFVVDTTLWRVAERRLGDKATAVRSLAGGGTEKVSLHPDRDQACLSEEQVVDLARLGADVQTLYGSPQDIEWAIEESGRLWLTQARPITTLYPLVLTPHRDPRAFLCVTLAQGLTRPITPMGLATFRLVGSSVVTAAGHPPQDRFAGPAGFTVAGQRAFVDITPLLRHHRARRAMLAVAGIMEARTRTVLQELQRDPRFAAIPTGSAVPIMARVMAWSKAPLHAAVALISPRLAYRGLARLERRLRNRLTVAANASPERRLDHVEDRLGTDTFKVMPSAFGYAAPGLFMMALARKLLAGLADDEETQRVLRGVPHNVTTEMDLQLWQLTQRIRADAAASEELTRPTAEVVEDFRRGRLSPVVQTGLAAFLRRYGHRAVGEIDLGMPRWSDDPSHLVGMISNYLRVGDDLDPEAQFARGAAEAEATVDDLVRRARAAGPLRGVVVSFALRRARALVGLREKPKSLLVFTLAALRAQLDLVGQALAAAGRIDHAADIFFLDLLEARGGLAGAALHDVVTERRRDYAVELRRRHIPRILLSDGTEPEATARPVSSGVDGGLSGSPASAGIVTGPARVVLDPVGAHLEPGEILVAPSTDPGWTPLFLTAGGLVMEMGGANSHGAVVAREYGIPAVVGVPDATHTIRTGQQVTVDGAAGRVLVG